jgi:hypothetical protein
MIAHQRVDCRGRAAIGHIGYVDICCAPEHLDGDVQGGSRSAAREREFAWLGACRGDQIVQRAVWRRAQDNEDHRRRREIADRFETPRWIIVRSPQGRIGDERIRHQQNRMTIRLGALDRFGSNHGAAARAILDHHRRSLRAADLLRHQARQDVGAAARRVRNDDLDRSRRLRPRAGAERCQ